MKPWRKKCNHLSYDPLNLAFSFFRRYQSSYGNINPYVCENLLSFSFLPLLYLLRRSKELRQTLLWISFFFLLLWKRIRNFINSVVSYQYFFPKIIGNYYFFCYVWTTQHKKIKNVSMSAFAYFIKRMLCVSWYEGSFLSYLPSYIW